MTMATVLEGNVSMPSSQVVVAVECMIAALCGQQLLAPFTVEGPYNCRVFETWLETCLIPQLKPGQKLILNPATFHKGGRIQALVQACWLRGLVFASLCALFESD